MNRTQRRSARARWAITALVVLILVLQAAPRAAAAAERLRVAHSTLTATNSVLWVARDRGIFPRHGLDVSLIYVAGVRSRQALLAQEVEIGSVSERPRFKRICQEPIALLSAASPIAC